MNRKGNSLALLCGVMVILIIIVLGWQAGEGKKVSVLVQENARLEKGIEDRDKCLSLSLLIFDKLNKEIASLTKALNERTAEKIAEVATKTVDVSLEENIAVATMTVETYEIDVKDRPLGEAIKAGKYDYVNSSILENFQGTSVPGKKEVSVICFNRYISSEDAVKEMAKMNLRPADIWDELAFGEKYPDLQRKYPIVALGSSCELSGRRRVPLLYELDSGRDLYLSYWGGGWFGDCRFLAVRN